MDRLGDERMEDIAGLLEMSGRFTEEEISGAEEYLSGAAGQEALDEFPYRDLREMPEAAQICGRFGELLRRKDYAPAGRLGRLLFAAGRASGYELYPADYFFCQGEELWMEPSGKAALFAMAMGRGSSSLKGKSFQRLFQTADCRLENLRKAMDYLGRAAECESEGGSKAAQNGRLVLLAAYFAFRRPELCVEAEDQGGQGGTGMESQSSQDGMDAENQGGQNGTAMECRGSQEPPLGDQERRRLEQYEGLLLDMLPYVYQSKLGKETVERAVHAVKQDKVDEELLKRISVRGLMTDISFRLMVVCAFLNYTLSEKLRNMASICLAADAETALGAIKDADIWGVLRKQGGDFDTIFGVDSRKLIRWAAEHDDKGILEEQFRRNPAAYLACMREANFYIYCRMIPIVEAQGEEASRTWQNRASYSERKRIAEVFADTVRRHLKKADRGLAEDVGEYLRHGNGLEAVYACRDAAGGSLFWAFGLWGTLRSYQKKFGYDVFSNRCETLLAASQALSTYGIFEDSRHGADGAQEPREVLKRLFASMESEGVDVEHQLGAYVSLYESTDDEDEMRVMREVGKEVFGAYFSQSGSGAQEAFRKAGDAGRILALEIMAQDAERNREEILKYTEDASKQVGEVLLRILHDQTGWMEEAEGLLHAKKAPVREIGVRVLAGWLEETGLPAGDAASRTKQLHDRYMEMLRQALEKEKSAKIKGYIQKALQTGGGEGGSTLSEEELVKEIHKGNRKRVLAWAYASPFSKVHRKDGREAEEEYLQAILLCYYVMVPLGVSGEASFLAASLEERELAVYVNELYDRWLEAGAEAKKRWVLYAAAIHGGGEMVRKLYRQIKEWSKEARGVMAAEAVMALALSPDPQGLLTVDAISRRFKYKQVKTAAGKALEYAASQLGITGEELADRIVPDLGFDEKMERVFDYGSRRFTVRITTALEAEVFDEKGGRLKSMPTPGKRDEEEKAAEAYEEFKRLKKQLKTVASGQKLRLESALSTGRQWSVQAWKKLFVKNPVMHQFAIGLIWGVYENGKLKTAFRYMEDGSFNTEEGEEFALPGEEADTAPNAGQPAAQGRFAGEDKTVGRERAIGQGGSLGQGGAVGQGGSVGQGSSVGQGGAVGQGGFLVQGGSVVQGSSVGQGGSISQSGSIGQGGSVGQSSSVGQGGSISQSSSISQDQLIGRDQFIGLVHPIELSEDSINAWKEQLADYEIVQPLIQIERPVYHRTEEEAGRKSLERFGGVIVNHLALGGKLTALGWCRGQAEAGEFDTYYREDRELSLRAELLFSGSYIGDMNQDVTIYEVNFYKTGAAAAGMGRKAGSLSAAGGRGRAGNSSLTAGGYGVGSGSKSEMRACALKDLPDRYFSEMVWQVSQAAALGRGRDEDWRKNRK